jgi:stage V sporulation protein S
MAVTKETKQIRVSGKSPVPQLAGSIVKSIEDGFTLEVRAVGASAVNQMYKGIAVARGTLASKGKDLLIKPGFAEITEGDLVKTVMIANLVIQ